MNLIQTIEQEEIARLGKTIPDFAPGDTVVVNVNVVEGDRKRVQAYEGVVIAKRNRGLNSSFIVRKISSGEGVERTFQTYSPLIASIEVKRRGDVRRAKLYYLRERSGKSARIREKLALQREASGAVNAQLAREKATRRVAFFRALAACYNAARGHQTRLGAGRIQREIARTLRCARDSNAPRAPRRDRISAPGSSDTRAHRCIRARSLPPVARLFPRSGFPIRSALRRARHRVPGARLGSGARDSARRDVELSRCRAPDRLRAASGRHGLRRQSHSVADRRAIASSPAAGWAASCIAATGQPLEIKRWLLRHEGALD